MDLTLGKNMPPAKTLILSPQIDVKYNGISLIAATVLWLALRGVLDEAKMPTTC